MHQFMKKFRTVTGLDVSLGTFLKKGTRAVINLGPIGFLRLIRDKLLTNTQLSVSVTPGGKVKTELYEGQSEELVKAGNLCFFGGEGNVPHHDIDHPTLGRLAVHAHIFYTDQLNHISDRLMTIRWPFDLYISTDRPEKSEIISKHFKQYGSIKKIDVRVTPNRGRDIAPMLVEFDSALKQYRLALHIHSKKSPYGSSTQGWDKHLFDAMLHSPLYVTNIIDHFETHDDVGIVGAPAYSSLIEFMTWSGNKGQGQKIWQRLGLPSKALEDPLNFSAGSFMWFRPEAISQFLGADFSFDDFDAENGQRNNTTAHAIERLFGNLCRHNGFQLLSATPSHNTGQEQLSFVRDYFQIPIIERPKAPEVSIIIPVYNQWDLTRQCIASVVRNTDQDLSYEIIIGDDCSSDETAEALKDLPFIKHVPTDRNVGFLRNCQNAAKQADGKYILFLNNDTQVQPNWLSSLIDVFQTRPDAGLVGSKLVYPDGDLQEAGCIIWENGNPINVGRNGDRSLSELNYVRAVDSISGASIMLNRNLWEKLGGFDERFAPAYYEDTDLAMQVRAQGLQVYFQPASVVIHYEGRSNGTDLNQGQKAYQVKNADTFKEKWHGQLLKDHTRGELLFRARERSMNQPITVFIDTFVPEPDRHAGARHTYNYMKLLQSMGHQVKFLAVQLGLESEIVTANRLRQEGIEVHLPDSFNTLVDWSPWLTTRCQGQALDLVVINRPHNAVQYLDLCKNQLKVKTLYFAHDLAHRRLALQQEIEPEKISNREIKAERAREQYIFENADFSVTPSSDEAHYLNTQLGCANTAAIPLFLFNADDFVDREMPEGQNFIFVGGMAHAPNPNAIEWMAKQVMFPLLKRCPDAVFHIVGAPVTKEIALFESDSFKFHGYVSDQALLSLYKRSKAVVVPLQFGAGVKGKTVEALTYGIPLVSTTVGIEGIQGIDSMIQGHDDPADFVDQLATVLEYGQSQWQALSSKQTEFAHDQFSFDAGRAAINNILNDINLKAGPETG